MSNFSPKLQESTDDQLWHLINESSPVYAALASDELTRRSSNKLQEANDKLSRVMLALAIIQVIIGSMQLLVPIFISPGKQWIGVLVELILASAIFYVFWGFNKKKK